MWSWSQTPFLRGAKYLLMFPKGPDLDHGSSSWWSTISTSHTCHVEIHRRYHHCGNYTLWWGEPRPKVLTNTHIEEVIKKANKHVFYIILLCRADILPNDMVTFHCMCVGSILEYCLPVFHHALPKYLQEDIERVQKRALIWECNYENNLSLFNLSSLGSRRDAACSKLFNNMCIPSHKPHRLVLQRHQPRYNLRRPITFLVYMLSFGDAQRSSKYLRKSSESRRKSPEVPGTFLEIPVMTRRKSHAFHSENFGRYTEVASL